MVLRRVDQSIDMIVLLFIIKSQKGISIIRSSYYTFRCLSCHRSQIGHITINKTILLDRGFNQELYCTSKFSFCKQQQYFFFFEKLAPSTYDEVAELLRRWIANPLCPHVFECHLRRKYIIIFSKVLQKQHQRVRVIIFNDRIAFIVQQPLS